MKQQGQPYRVSIHYREPTYELYSGREHKKPYVVNLEVIALDEAAARKKALEEFRRTWRDSSVGWIRRVERVLVTQMRAR